MGAGHELLPRREINPEKAGMHGRRAGDPDMDFPRTGHAQHGDPAARRIAPDNGIIDHHHPFAPDDVRHNGQLHIHAGRPLRGVRHNKGAADIVVADEAVVQRDAAAAGIAQGGRIPAVGDRDDHIRFGRMLLRQPHAQAVAHAVDAFAEN